MRICVSSSLTYLFIGRKDPIARVLYAYILFSLKIRQTDQDLGEQHLLGECTQPLREFLFLLLLVRLRPNRGDIMPLCLVALAFV